MSLGIDKDKHIVYEGHVYWGGRPLSPAPCLLGLQVADAPEHALDLLKQSQELSRLLFREDTFDPVSMVRRGRIYEPSPSHPVQCSVCPLGEAELNEARQNGGVVRKSLFCYERYPLRVRVSSTQPYAAVGTSDGYSLWRIVSHDRTFFDEELITMRPLYFLGAIPDLAVDAIPEPWRTKLQEATGKVVDSMYRADASSIVDLCRNAASASLLTCFSEDITELNKTDLGPLAKKAEAAQRRIVASSAKIINDLHSRGKVNIQVQHGCRSATDRDAELAVQCLSFILRDLGYTRSP